MPAIPIEITVDVPDGEYERIEAGHAFHVSWPQPERCRCETGQQERPLHVLDKAKFLVIRDLDIWGQPSFFVYQDRLHRCAQCGHRQALIPPFKRRIGLDEISLKKGHKAYATILTDLTDPGKPEVLAVAKGRDEKAAEQCLAVLSAASRAQVATHNTDMSAAYLAACRALLPNSQSVVDRFHVAKKLGEVTDGLRKKTTGLISEDCPPTNASACGP